jgi:hypothetical protein
MIYKNWIINAHIYTISYFLGAKLCQLFSIEPGNVTPIWISLVLR